jgi:hypothetical protein
MSVIIIAVVLLLVVALVTSSGVNKGRDLDPTLKKMKKHQALVEKHNGTYTPPTIDNAGLTAPKISFPTKADRIAYEEEYYGYDVDATMKSIVNATNKQDEILRKQIKDGTIKVTPRSLSEARRISRLLDD